MTGPSHYPVLLIQPWLSAVGCCRAYALFDALPMAADGRMPTLDSITVLQTSPDGRSPDHLRVRHGVGSGCDGQAVGFVDALVSDLHQDCRERLRAAA